jgi:RNA polymerase sigma-70 factor, ECF subfamily
MIASPLRQSTPARPLGTDPVAFRAFYAEALPRVHGYLLRRCGGSVETAEDLTQDTFLAAVSELRRGRRINLPIPWVLGIARHKLVDHYRRQERTEPRSPAMAAQPAQVPIEGGDVARERTLTALAAVPAAQRAALVLRHLDGLSVPEAAQALGRSIESVESLLARGRVSLKRAYLEVDA